MFDEPDWDVCERCGTTVDRREEGLIHIVWERRGDPIEEGVLSEIIPFVKVCGPCADELVELLDGCNLRCGTCLVTQGWGLSIKECILNQMKWEIIPVPEPTQEEWALALPRIP